MYSIIKQRDYENKIIIINIINTIGGKYNG